MLINQQVKILSARIFPSFDDVYQAWWPKQFSGDGVAPVEKLTRSATTVFVSVRESKYEWSDHG